MAIFKVRKQELAKIDKVVVEFELEEDNGEINLVAQKKDDPTSAYTVLYITVGGTLKFINNVPSNLELKLNEEGRIKIDN